MTHNERTGPSSEGPRDEKREWTPTRCVAADLPDVGLFFKRQFKGRGSYGSLSLFDWKTRANYVMPGFVNAIKDAGTIVSTTSITPKRVLVDHVSVPAAEIGDTYTDNNYQRRGFFSLLINQSRADAEAAGIGLIYGTPNDQSLPGYKKNARFDVIPSIAVSHWTLPVNVAGAFRARGLWLAAGVLAAVVEGVSFIYSGLRRLLVRTPHGVTTEKEHTVPEHWDDFWSVASRDYDFIGDRGSDAIDWRFFRSPNDYAFLTIRRERTIVGFVCTRLVPDAARGTQLVVADYLVRPGEEAALAACLSRLVTGAFRSGVSDISTWVVDGSSFEAVFKRLGFIRRMRVPVIAYMNETYERLRGARAVHFTIADSDNA